MPDKNHPLWKLLAITVVGAIGLAYCSLAYHNGTDLTKDGGLIALVGGLSAAATKIFSSDK
jgi:hypothetical protein